MNRLHRFGTALFHVGLVVAFVSFVALTPFAQAGQSYLWVPILALVVSGVIAGAGYVVAKTFDDTPRPDPDADGQPPPLEDGP